MRKLFPSFICLMLALVSIGELRASNGTEELNSNCMPVLEAEMPFCFLVITNPADGNCPAQYTFAAPLFAGPFQWSVSGDAYFNSGTTSNQASVIPQRSLNQSGSFTITLLKGDGTSCSRTFSVSPEDLCE